MADYSEFYKARDFVVDLVKKEMIGPQEEDGVLRGIKPLDSYTCGILWPKNFNGKDFSLAEQSGNKPESLLESEFDDGVDAFIPDIEEPDIDNVAATQVICPSTMGITVMLGPDVRHVRAVFSFAKYVHGTDKAVSEKGHLYDKHYYTRNDYRYEMKFDFSEDRTKYTPESGEDFKNEGISFVATKRLTLSGGERLITFSVSNEIISDRADIARNENSFFQCGLQLVPMEGSFVPLISKYSSRRSIDDDILEMQYKDEYNFAQGHGCATMWDAEGTKCRSVCSDFIPMHELKQMKPLCIPDEETLSLRFLYSADRAVIVKKLRAFADMYLEWYGNQSDMSKTDEYSQYSQAATECLKRILECEKRIRRGIEILSSDDTAWESFVCANKAMYYQRISMALMKGNIKSEEDFADDPRWYPFQLFYLIMIIPDFVDELSPYKDTVDLLWFPTGGGKTEAYLAVSAFTIFYDRLSTKRKRYGTTIIMRYTLRLLTIQQFERAAALICSCDRVRIEEDIPGNEISLGLWIGSASTPNNIDDAKEALEKLVNRETPGESNPVQLVHCPCCGATLSERNYDIANGHMKITCGKCGNKLPIYDVDTDIYDFMPTLVISTVDKFARIVWEEKSGNIFGHCDNVRVNKPRLIIQDELHLISGALGTLTGLYESAVDRLCWDDDGRKPKIISSTATVKNASYQIKGLYDRDYFQFPPSGLSHKDSFFAVEATREEKPARMYVGLSHQGGSIIGLMIKLYSILLVADFYLEKQGYSEDVVDQYYTIIGYFNTIRELGSVSSMLQERIMIYINSLLRGKFANLSEKYGVNLNDDGRFIYGRKLMRGELTSRKNATEVRNILKNLEIHYTDEESNQRAYSYVLCSNMFSVGVDIDRLGLMAVYGQPKGNSDYIQATSRVGRSAPGLIFTMYGSVNTRDRSYYEQFNQYHDCFYKFVEPTSVTPFSIRSIERGLHSVFVAIVRNLCPGMRGNGDANKFSSRMSGVEEIKDYLLNRIRDIQPGAVEEAEGYLNAFIRHWETLARGNLVYNKQIMGRKYNDFTALLEPAESQNSEFTTLNSLRNVEQLSGIYIELKDLKRK